MWPGPYGDWGSRKYLLGQPRPVAAAGWAWTTSTSSTSHRFDPEHAAGGDDGRAGHRRPRRARRSTSASRPTPPERTARGGARSCGELGTPLLIHQPSLLDAQPLDRGRDLLDALERDGRRAASRSRRWRRACSPTATSTASRPTRAPRRTSRCRPDLLTEENLAHIRALNEIADGRGQTLAQLALAWVLRDERVTSALIGASSVAQLEDSLGAVGNLGLHRRRAGRDRPLRHRGRHQPLADAEHGVARR